MGLPQVAHRGQKQKENQCPMPDDNYESFEVSKRSSGRNSKPLGVLIMDKFKTRSPQALQ